MNWGSPSEFFAMGGHGLYVWGSFGVLALFILIEVVVVKKRRKELVQRLKRLTQARAKMVEKE